jgi:outer membrane protein
MFRTTALLVVLGGLLAPGLAGADVKIGYVDLQRALNEVDEGKQAKSRLEAKFNKSQEQLNKEQTELQKKKDELDKKRLAMDEATLRAKADELDKEMVRITNLFSKLQKELSDEERVATQEIFRKMRLLIAGIAEKEGFSFVFDVNESGMIYGPPSQDLTNELVRRYNEQAGAAAKKPSPKK